MQPLGSSWVYEINNEIITQVMIDVRESLPFELAELCHDLEDAWRTQASKIAPLTTDVPHFSWMNSAMSAAGVPAGADSASAAKLKNMMHAPTLSGWASVLPSHVSTLLNAKVSSLQPGIVKRPQVPLSYSLNRSPAVRKKRSRGDDDATVPDEDFDALVDELVQSVPQNEDDGADASSDVDGPDEDERASETEVVSLPSFGRPSPMPVSLSTTPPRRSKRRSVGRGVTHIPLQGDGFDDDNGNSIDDGTRMIVDYDAVPFNFEGVPAVMSGRTESMFSLTHCKEQCFVLQGGVLSVRSSQSKDDEQSSVPPSTQRDDARDHKEYYFSKAKLRFRLPIV